jgi:hypothetical protein
MLHSQGDSGKGGSRLWRYRRQSKGDDPLSVLKLPNINKSPGTYASARALVIDSDFQCLVPALPSPAIGSFALAEIVTSELNGLSARAAKSHRYQ